MPHRRRSSSPRRRRIRSALLSPLVAGLSSLTLLACTGPGDASEGDSTAAAAAPAASLPDRPTSGPAADSLARLRLLADSARRLDAAFQRLRDSLVAESRALAALDRRTAEYARRYDAYVLREREATALRSRRDSLRTRAEGRAP